MHRPASYLFALLATAAAVAIRALLDPWLQNHVPLVTLFAAVAATVWFGGYRPALLAAVLGFLSCEYLFVAPRGSFVFREEHLAGLLGYTVSCSLIIGFGDAMRRARQRASERWQLLQTTLASIGDAVITTDTHGRIRYLNGTAESLTGWTLDEARGRPIDDIFHIIDEETRERARNPVTRALGEGVIVGLSNHTVLIRKDGTERAIDDSAAPIRDGQGRATGCVLVFRDVTERRRTERALQRSEREFREFFENASVGLHWVGRDGTILRVNAAELNLLGYTREEYVGHHISEFHADAQAIDEILRRLGAGEELHDYAAPMRCKDGSIKNVMISSNVLWEDGEFIHTRCFTLDVTGRMRAEQALRDSEERYRALVAATTSIVWTTDAQGAFVSPQPSWETFTGQTGEQHQGFGWSEALHPQDREGIRVLWSEALRQRRPYHSAGRLWHAPSQSYRDFEARAIPLVRPDGRVKEWVGICTDITERKRAEEALKEGDRRKDEFLATLAHELRNPLAPITNYLEIMKRTEDATLMERARSALDQQVSVMKRLIDDLLDISRITRNRLELRKERIELASTLHQALEACSLTATPQRQVSVTLPPKPIYLTADPVRLVQVFGNLLNNACQYTKPGGRISLTARREADTIVVSVRDNGVGIPPGMLPHIFEMFTQADESLDRSHEGMGIGLTLVKQLVEMHGGRVEALSDGPGQGSEFIVRLPILAYEPLEEPPRPPSAGKPAAASYRILIVDDHEQGARSLATLLEMSGHEAKVVYDGHAALEAVKNLLPDVVLLDIGLPQLSGLEVCRRIREQTWGKGMVLVALTGWGQEEDRRKSKEAGFDAHLVKPVKDAELTKLLASLISEEGGRANPEGT